MTITPGLFWAGSRTQLCMLEKYSTYRAPFPPPFKCFLNDSHTQPRPSHMLDDLEVPMSTLGIVYSLLGIAGHGHRWWYRLG